MRSRPRPDQTPQGQLAEAGLHAVLGYQVAQASIVTLEIYERCVGKVLGLRPVEFTLLALIRQNPGGTPARLARALAVTAPSISTWMDRLASRQLVRREASTTDRRAQHLYVTSQGAELVDEAVRLIRSGEAAALKCLTPAERAMLAELLHKVACSRFAGSEDGAA